MDAKDICPQCPLIAHSQEWFVFLGSIVFDVVKARKLAESSVAGFVSPERLEQYGIPMTPPEESIFRAGLVTVNEEHLAHIPEAALAQPVLFGTLPFGSEETNFLMDGAHTATIKARRGEQEIAAVVLDAIQTKVCCIRGWPLAANKKNKQRARPARRRLR